VEYGVKFSECQYISELDAQKEAGKAIYAGGLLINDEKAAEKAAAEKAAAEKAGAIVWELSEREREIIERLNQNKA
jgi:putative heme iron utilization protein